MKKKALKLERLNLFVLSDLCFNLYPGFYSSTDTWLSVGGGPKLDIKSSIISSLKEKSGQQ